MVAICSVLGCSNRGDQENKSFYRIPKVILHQGQQTEDLSRERREKWLVDISREDLRQSDARVIDHHRICSDHFISGKPSSLYDTKNPDWVPTVKLDNLDFSKPIPTSSKHTKIYGKRKATAEAMQKRTEEVAAALIGLKGKQAKTAKQKFHETELIIEKTDKEDDIEVLFIEPFYGGSHKQLIDLLVKETPRCKLYSLPAKKWHWRARCSAIHFSQVIPQSDTYKVLFCSSVLNLSELVALRPDLAKLKKIVYFHENQLVYPVRKQQDRDFQYGYNQVLTSMVANKVIFNSKFNMNSFLKNIKTFLNIIPDYKPKDITQDIKIKSSVLNFPLSFPDDANVCTQSTNPSANTEEDMDVDEKPNENSDIKSIIDNVSASQDVILKSLSSQDNDDSGNVQKVGQKVEVAGQSPVKVIQTGQINSPAREILPQSVALSSSNTTQSQHTLASNKRVQPVSNITQSANRVVTSDNSKSPLTSASTAVPREISITEYIDTVLKSNSERLDINLAIKAQREEQMQVEKDKEREGQVQIRIPQENGECIPFLHIVWAHRWEHDKDPDTFFKVMYELKKQGYCFHISVIGECYSEYPEIFDKAKLDLADHIVNWGYQESKEKYYQVLMSADVVISTAKHEFFGVAMLEAVHHGCYPICPNSLVYPEIFPRDCLYNTENQLFKKLAAYCEKPNMLRRKPIPVDTKKYTWETLRKAYQLAITF